MTSKRAYLQKVTVLLTSTTKNGGFTWRFSVAAIIMDNS